MRIRFIHPRTGLQELAEIERVRQEGNSIFLTIGGYGVRELCYILKAPEGMSEQEIQSEYIGLVTRLGIDGYANLCFGEPTCPLNDTWTIMC